MTCGCLRISHQLINESYILNYSEAVRYFKYRRYGVSLIRINIIIQNIRRLTEGEAYLQYHHLEFSGGQNGFF